MLIFHAAPTRYILHGIASLAAAQRVSEKYTGALAAKLGHIGIRRHFFRLAAIGEAEGRRPGSARPAARLK